MFLTESQLQSRLQKNLRFANKIDIATAWATPGSALDALENTVRKSKKPKVRLRAIVGISGNATHPDALERLKKIGQLRLAACDGRIFHPKVYIFRGPRKSVAWIGSANFTGGGFQKNEETIFETEDVDSIVKWFDARWAKCGELKPTDIDDYRERWARHPPSKEMCLLVSPLSPTPTGHWVSLESFDKVKANPYPTQIRFKGKDIDCEWTESKSEAWRKMFGCVADWLVREGKLTEHRCPIEITGGSEPFPCVGTDPDELLKLLKARDQKEGWGKGQKEWTRDRLRKISKGMWVAVPRTPNMPARRAKQLLEHFRIDPSDVELRMSE